LTIIGRTLGRRYKVLSLLGKGGMGAVYEAEQTDLARRVAIKVLAADADEDTLVRFKQEALAAAGLAHPNIVQVYDFIEGEEPLIVMELLRGRSLAALVKQTGKLAPERAVSIMTQVLAALAAAHEARIVHRDVKPENIFVCEPALPHEVVKVLDFGLARPLDEARHIARTRMGVALGTPAYMAPEQASGKNADVRMDVFAAGVTLYYALAGRRPFEGKTTSELVRAVRMQPPIPLDALCPELDLDLIRIVERSLSKDPKGRYASARELLDVLLPFAGGRRTTELGVTAPPKREQQTTAAGRKRPVEIEPLSPAITPGMVSVARFAPDGDSALAIGPSGLARWTLAEGWSARELPWNVDPASFRAIAFGPTAAEAVLVRPDGAIFRARGTYAHVETPRDFVVAAVCVVDEHHIVLAGKLGNDATVVDRILDASKVYTIARGITMLDVAWIDGAIVACGERGTLCIIERGRVHAHVAGRAALRGIAPLGSGCVAVGDDGAFVRVSAITTDALATATESHLVDDDLCAVRTHGGVVCAIGRRVHLTTRDAAPPKSLTPGAIRDAWVGKTAARILLDNAAVLETTVVP
jgi:hypothetical protein